MAELVTRRCNTLGCPRFLRRRSGAPTPSTYCGGPGGIFSFTLDIEDEKIGLLQTTRELRVTVVAYSPLGRGLLTGRYKSPDDFHEGDLRRYVPRYSEENFPNILKLVDGLEAIGERHGATAGQVALAWLLAQGNDIIPIPGTKSVKYLKETLGAASFKLTPEEIAEVRAAAVGRKRTLPKESGTSPG
ncbi:Aldo/keto reductase [Gloeophyllum trabeum ATCC 11539]|uniref:Aldo/keto reductase n=1 Tax=Gloeophyllum trabeum (strain ATCC 11539 / FP-39264 / Madison 617) TaxID=670483 RepID=S7QH75_GLOTA|nr:Aldo/keto reductase [Gloeophyllum trabeum ATCC 11539]EPQ58502.1 Aldo/keto reductase [Gloeophyllum trabeum ATCC 11539]